MGTIAQKVSRLEDTKALLKQRLTEKGIDVSDENVFYRLADKVGDIVGGTGIIYTKLQESNFYKRAGYFEITLPEEVDPGFKAAFISIGLECDSDYSGTGIVLHEQDYYIALEGPFNGSIQTDLYAGVVPILWSVSGNIVTCDMGKNMHAPTQFYTNNAPYSFFAY